MKLSELCIVVCNSLEDKAGVTEQSLMLCTAGVVDEFMCRSRNEV